MLINAVVVCVNYGDILAHTLPHTRQYFKNTLVVTDANDAYTAELCSIYNVMCYKTDVFYSKGSRFDKGAAINEALQVLDVDTSKDWFLQLDADIFLPRTSIEILYKLNLNPQYLYGCDRIMMESFEEWMKFYEKPNVWNSEFWQMELDKFKVGSRLTFYYSGEMWQVLGFFQLWNPNSSGVKSYPSFTDASSSDIIFSSQWARSRRILLPEVLAVHLENEQTAAGKNWQGRKTAPFTI